MTNQSKFLYVDPKDEDAICNETDFSLRFNQWPFCIPNRFDLYRDRITFWARTQGVIGSVLSKGGGTTILSFKFSKIEDIVVEKYLGSYKVVLIVPTDFLIADMFSPGRMTLAGGMKKDDAEKLKQALLKFKNGDFSESTTHLSEDTIERRILRGTKFTDQLFGAVFPVIIKIGVSVVVVLSLLLLLFLLLRSK